MAQPAARLLDLTRLVSRSGRGLTGIDRVELAYATELSKQSTPLFGLVQSSVGFLLLEEIGVRSVVEATRTGNWGRPDLLSRFSIKLGKLRQAGQSFVRSRSIDRCLPKHLPRMLARHLPIGTAYINVGHSNLSAQVLGAIRAIEGARITIMIHDTIPLDLPDLQRPGTVARFAEKLDLAVSHADHILTPSLAARSDLLRHRTLDPGTITGVPLGLTPFADAPLPPPIPEPYFLCLGTIEPRKNHALLLDVWEALARPRPTLVVAGRRGWLNEEVFARLDAGIEGVLEQNALDDASVASLLTGAEALLFPSLAEGFGLPAIEAASVGCPVICSDLPVLREVLDGKAVYLPTDDRYSWKNAIEARVRAGSRDKGDPARANVQNWSDHFSTVLKLT